MSPARDLMERLSANAYLLLVMASLFWAGNAIAGKLAAGSITPTTLTFLRWMIACLIMAPMAWPHVIRERHTIRNHWLRLVIMGGVGFSGFNLTLYAALGHTSALNVTIEQACMPVAIMLGSYLVFRQRIGVWQLVGVVVSIIGVLVTATRGAPLTLFEIGLNRGDALMMLAILLYSGYTIALRHKPRMHWLSLLFCMALGAWLVSVPALAIEIALQGFSWPDGHDWTIILYTAVFPSLMSQLFFLRGVELLGANRAGAFINLVPIFGAVLAVAILGEAFQVHHLGGLVMVLGGIAIAERSVSR